MNNKVIIILLSAIVLLLIGFLGVIIYNNNESEKRAEQAKVEAQKAQEQAEKLQKKQEQERLKAQQLADEQRQAEIEAEAQRKAQAERQKAMAQQAAVSGPYYISGTLNGDDVDFDIYVYDDGSVSGTFTNYSMGTGWDVGGTMKANSFSFYSIGNSVNWKFNATRSSGSSFTGTCSSGKISYKMYLNVSRQ